MDSDSDMIENDEDATSFTNDCLSSLLERIKIASEQEKAGKEDPANLQEILKELTFLPEYNPEDPADFYDALLNMRVTCGVSSILLKCIQEFDETPVNYDPNEFVRKIKEKVAGDSNNYTENDLLKLMDETRLIAPSVPNYDTMYCKFDENELGKVQAPRKERQKAAPAQKKEIRKVKDDEEVLTENVKDILYVFNMEYEKRKAPIDYNEFVIDTHDFTKTVYNMFYMSLLFRDGKIGAVIGENGNMQIVPIDNKKLKQFQKEGKENTQCVMEITKKQWNEMKHQWKEGIKESYDKRI